MSAEELSKDQVALLKNAFDTFDVEKKGSIGTVMIGTILSMLGVQTTEQMLADIINEVDEDGTYRTKIAYLGPEGTIEFCYSKVVNYSRHQVQGLCAISTTLVRFGF
ncbi:unnamed protein product [Acanthoscelides obtectus]|uniref:EF-hand domain-containing protein n=1 Tax=Acanthoscelides obtectus TaxID=200917 RepID=A0A9P0Q5D0_ACAOB|nr:unnamed protein product [Acanthoscelides obtectus]CAK1621627.1 Troponin C, isoform 1 [Acanthoscelides obtectus]